MHFDSAILGSAGPGAIISDRAALAEAEIVSPEDRNAILFREISPDCLSASFCELIVISHTANKISKTCDLQNVVRPTPQLSRELVQLSTGLWSKGIAVKVEVHSYRALETIAVKIVSQVVDGMLGIVSAGICLLCFCQCGVRLALSALSSAADVLNT